MSTWAKVQTAVTNHGPDSTEALAAVAAYATVQTPQPDHANRDGLWVPDRTRPGLWTASS